MIYFIFGFVILALIPLILRVRKIITTRNYIELMIKTAWNRQQLYDVNNLVEKDNFTLAMLRDIFFNEENDFDKYRLLLGVLRSMNDNIISDKKKFQNFKNEFILYGKGKGWAA